MTAAIAVEVDREQLIRDHLRLVHAAAWQLVRSKPAWAVDPGDLISDGYHGLCSAASRFNPETGVTFQSYAYSRIRGAMLDGIRKLDPVGRADRKAWNTIDRARHKFAAREQHFPNDLELAAELGWPVADLARVLRTIRDREGLSLDQDVAANTHKGGFEVPATLADFVADPDADTERQALRQIDRDRVPAMLERLPERERFVLALYYFEDCTLAEIAPLLNVTESRVSQLKATALSRLRAMLPDDMSEAA